LVLGCHTEDFSLYKISNDGHGILLSVLKLFLGRKIFFAESVTVRCGFLFILNCKLKSQTGYAATAFRFFFQIRPVGKHQEAVFQTVLQCFSGKMLVLSLHAVDRP
jgi:hypothetical protein